MDIDAMIAGLSRKPPPLKPTPASPAIKRKALPTSRSPTKTPKLTNQATPIPSKVAPRQTTTTPSKADSDSPSMKRKIAAVTPTSISPSDDQLGTSPVRKMPRTASPTKEKEREDTLPEVSAKSPTNPGATSSTPPHLEKTVVVDTLEGCHEAVAEIVQYSVIAVDCEGVNLGRAGELCLVQVGLGEERVYLFDILAGTRSFFEEGGLRQVLEDPERIKIMHDCRGDSDALYHQYNVRLKGVFDTQIGFAVVKKQLMQPTPLPVGLNTLLRIYATPLLQKQQQKNLPSKTSSQSAPHSRSQARSKQADKIESMSLGDWLAQAGLKTDGTSTPTRLEPKRTVYPSPDPKHSASNNGPTTTPATSKPDSTSTPSTSPHDQQKRESESPKSPDETRTSAANTFKEEARKLMIEDENFWRRRPLTPLMVGYAGEDVLYLTLVYKQIDALLYNNTRKTVFAYSEEYVAQVRDLEDVKDRRSFVDGIPKYGVASWDYETAAGIEQAKGRRRRHS